MQDACKALETLARLAEGTADEAKMISVIQEITVLTKGKPEAAHLEEELKVWQIKLPVILKEPVGRKGMAKHARFWAERLKNV